MKQRQAMKFKVTNEEMKALMYASDILNLIIRNVPNEYKIEAYNNTKYTIEEINAARGLIYSLGDYPEFMGYSTTEEESVF